MQTGERVRAQARPAGTRDVPARHDEAEQSTADRAEPVPLERIALTAIATDGAPLRPGVRAEMEARLGADFGGVRVHAGDVAAQAAQRLGAEAFTVGENLVFGRGMYAPQDAAGRHRLAHELAHVLQQRSGAARAAAWGVSRPGDALEAAAEHAAHDAMRGTAPIAGGQASPEHTAHDAKPPSAPASQVSNVQRASARTSAPSGPFSRPLIIQRRALLDLSPSREAASDAAADSPWLGMTAPGMLDFTGPTPKLTPVPGSDTDTASDSATDSDRSPNAPDQEEEEPEPEGSRLDPSAVPERDPEPPEPTPPAPPEPDPHAAARVAAHTDAQALAQTEAAFPDQPRTPAGTRPTPAEPSTASTETPAPNSDHEAPAAAQGQHPPGPTPAAGPAPAAAPGQKPATPATVPLHLPKFPDKTAEEFASLITADRDGQLSLRAAVDHALADIAAMMDRESARIDEGVKTAESTLTTATKQARGRVQGAAASARTRVDRARREQGDRAATQLTTKKNAVPADIETVATSISDVGSRKADAAQRTADDAATRLENARAGYMSTARRSGDDHAGRASSSAEEPEIRRASVSAQQQAAHDVAEQTATAVDDSISASVRDLRGGGPGLHTAVADQLAPLIRDQVRNQVGPMQQAMTTAGTQLDSALDGGVTNARTTIEQTALGLMNALAVIDRQTKRQLHEAADTTKAGLKRARADAEQQLHGKQAEFVTAAHGELGRRLTQVSSRPVRRALARRLSNELRSLLRNGYGLGANQANQLAGRVAGQLSSSLAQFHQELAAATQPATAGAESTATSAGTQFGQLEHKIVDFLSKAVTGTLTAVDASQSARLERLGDLAGLVDDRLVSFVDQTRERVDGDQHKADDDAKDKVGSLDGRIDQAMTKARDKAEYGAFGAWLLDQLRSLGKAMLTPSFWVGLLVGLLITIFIVATFGGGAVVLIIAGVVAGAISAAAAYTAQVYLDPLVDPSAPHKEFSARELRNQMLIGGIAGGVGAAAGGLATAGVNAIITNVAQRVVVNKVAQTVVGAALGAVQNCMTGPDGGVHWQFNTERWDEGLLTNVAVSTAMSSRGVEERIGRIQERARGTMVDRGLARNVTSEEQVHSQARFEARGAAEPGAAARTPAVPDLSGVHVDAGPVAPPTAPVVPAVPAEPHGPAGSLVPAEPHVPGVPPEPHAAAGSPAAAEPHVPGAPADHAPSDHAPADHVPAEHTPPPPPPAAVAEGHPAVPPAAGDHAAPAPHGPEPERAASAHAPEREGGPPAGPHDEHAHAGLPEADLTDMVMSGDTPMNEAEARHMYENARTDEPHNEFAIVRNSETGEHIVIQGNPDELHWHDSINSSLREFLRDRPGTPGRWDLVEHSHGVDPARGVTPEGARLPSGRGGDYQVAQFESELRGGAAVEQRIGIVTERGRETLHFGYDPTHEQPYSLRRPGPDGHPVTERFATMQEYGDWFARQPGTEGLQAHIDRPAAGTASAPPRRGGRARPSGGRAAATPPPVPEPRAVRQSVAEPPVVEPPVAVPSARRTRGARPAASAPRETVAAHPAPAAEHVAATPERPGSVAAPPAEHAVAPVEHPGAIPPAEHATAPAEHAGAAPPTPDHTAAPPATEPPAPQAPAGSGARDKAGNVHDARGRFALQPENGVVFLPELGESAPHTISADNAAEHQARVKQRNAAEGPVRDAELHVESLARELNVNPKDLVKSTQREDVARGLRQRGVPEEKVRALLSAEETRAQARDNLRQASERLGMLAGQDFLQAGGFTPISGDVNARGRPGEADLIGLNAAGDRLHVVEAKGGSAGLGPGRQLPEGRARQGSPQYLEDLLHRDPHFQQYLEAHPDFAARLTSGQVQIEYTMVSARADGSVIATPLELRGETPASTPVGVNVPVAGGTGERNTRAVISGREFSGGALDSMQSSRLVPSVVENTIATGVRTVGPRETVIYDPVNNVTVTIDTRSERVLGASRGRPQ